VFSNFVVGPFICSSLSFDDADIVEGDNALTIYLLNIQEIRFSFDKTNNFNDCKGESKLVF
jgi:hypothetical protein